MKNVNNPADYGVNRKHVKYTETVENMVNKNRGTWVRTGKNWGQRKFQCLNNFPGTTGFWNLK